MREAAGSDARQTSGAPQTKPPTSPAISAHRGGEEAACPGTYEAYQGAVAAGAEYVEFDVRRTSDGHLVAYHQARTPWARAISAVSYRRLCRLSGYDVPLVTDVMRLVAGRAAGHIDLKEARDATAVVGQAQEILGTTGFVVTTRDGVLAAELRQRFPGVRLALTVGGDMAEKHGSRCGGDGPVACPGWSGSSRARPAGLPCITGWRRRGCCANAGDAASRPWCGRLTAIRRWRDG